MCKIISAPSSWVAASSFPEGHQINRNVFQGCGALVPSVFTAALNADKSHLAR